MSFRRYSPVLLALALGCEHGHSDHGHGATPSPAPEPAASALGPPQNPVQAEMRALNAATRDWVTAIAQNDLGSIPGGIHRVHEARLVTEKALEKGEYRPPKPGSELASFKQKDEAFHGELVKLLQAAKANDLPGATKQLGVVLEGCTSCHLEYRF